MRLFLIHVTADNRYKLYVNGELVSLGPARGDLHHWRYESVDIAPHLKTGKNVLAAVVWNFGELAPEAQITNRTGLAGPGPRRGRAQSWTPASNGKASAMRPIHPRRARPRCSVSTS